MQYRIFFRWLVLLLPICSGGCVERYFVVDSEPRGAIVLVNNIPYSPTPAIVPYTYYGTYNIQLIRDGYQTMTISEEISAPWYGYPPLDFAVEVLYPFKVEDIRRFNYKLQPRMRPDPEQLLSDAQQLRIEGKALPEPKFPPEIPRDKRRPEPPAAPTAIPASAPTAIPEPKNRRRKGHRTKPDC